MDLQQPQASFIPKKPIVSDVAAHTGAPSILWLGSVFIFAVSIIAAVGVFGYNHYLQSHIAGANDSLTRAQAAYDPTSIEDLIRLNSRIEHAKVLLAAHAAPSSLFAFLADNTLSTVRFNSFNYSSNPDGTVSLKLSGNAIDFASVALQSDQFGAATRVLKNVIFSGLSIDPQTGIVAFAASANVSPSQLLYSTALSASPAAPSAPASQATSTGAAATSSAP